MDCAPPNTPASASMPARIMFISGCWVVSVLPAVCTEKRMRQQAGSVAPNFSFMVRA
ncbi:hypothetical protein D3C83_111120 [compost metagenome]